MCRFVMYLGPRITVDSLVTKPANSIIHQSYASKDRYERLNGDGFGVAWYAPEIGREPAAFRSISPAWNNPNLLNLARVTASECILAHVRATTAGSPVTETNCHPFTAGAHAFMHNGDVAGFRRIRRRLLGLLSDEAFDVIQGSTDSEHVFALFLDRLRDQDAADPAERLANALAAAIRQVVDLVRSSGAAGVTVLNVAVADGRRAVACRFNTGRAASGSSLHVHAGKRYECKDGACRLVDSEPGYESVLIASEPLSADPGWTAVPPNHLVVVHEDRRADVRPLPSMK